MQGTPKENLIYIEYSFVNTKSGNQIEKRTGLHISFNTDTMTTFCKKNASWELPIKRLYGNRIMILPAKNKDTDRGVYEYRFNNGWTSFESIGIRFKQQSHAKEFYQLASLSINNKDVDLQIPELKIEDKSALLANHSLFKAKYSLNKRTNDMNDMYRLSIMLFVLKHYMTKDDLRSIVYQDIFKHIFVMYQLASLDDIPRLIKLDKTFQLGNQQNILPKPQAKINLLISYSVVDEKRDEYSLHLSCQNVNDTKLLIEKCQKMKLSLKTTNNSITINPSYRGGMGFLFGTLFNNKKGKKELWIDIKLQHHAHYFFQWANFVDPMSNTNLHPTLIENSNISFNMATLHKHKDSLESIEKIQKNQTTQSVQATQMIQATQTINQKNIPPELLFTLSVSGNDVVYFKFDKYSHAKAFLNKFRQFIIGIIDKHGKLLPIIDVQRVPGQCIIRFSLEMGDKRKPYNNFRVHYNKLKALQKEEIKPLSEINGIELERTEYKPSADINVVHKLMYITDNFEQELKRHSREKAKATVVKTIYNWLDQNQQCTPNQQNIVIYLLSCLSKIKPNFTLWAPESQNYFETLKKELHLPEVDSKCSQLTIQNQYILDISNDINKLEKIIYSFEDQAEQHYNKTTKT